MPDRPRHGPGCRRARAPAPDPSGLWRGGRQCRCKFGGQRRSCGRCRRRPGIPPVNQPDLTCSAAMVVGRNARSRECPARKRHGRVRRAAGIIGPTSAPNQGSGGSAGQPRYQRPEAGWTSVSLADRAIHEAAPDRPAAVTLAPAGIASPARDRGRPRSRLEPERRKLRPDADYAVFGVYCPSLAMTFSA